MKFSPYRRSCPLAAVFTLVALVALAGCGGGDEFTKYKVTGQVTAGGQPVRKGSVLMFAAKSGPPAVTTIGEDGRYEIQVVAGEHRIQIQENTQPPSVSDDSVEGGLRYTGPPPKKMVPDKFKRFESSGMTKTVEAKNGQVINIEVLENAGSM